MITNVANKPSANPNFTSEVRMPYSTASTLSLYEKKVQKAIYKQLKNLEQNGEDNLVNVTYRYLKYINPCSGCEICSKGKDCRFDDDRTEIINHWLKEQVLF